MSLKEDKINLMRSAGFASCFGVFVSAYFITTMLKDMNASIFQMSLISVITLFGSCCALPLAILTGGAESKKASIIILIISRVLLLTAIPLILLHNYIPDNLLCSMLLIIFAAYFTVGCSAMGPAIAWFSKILPAQIQGYFLGRRDGMMQALGSIGLLVLGIMLEKYCVKGSNIYPIYAILLFAGIVFGAVDIYFLTRVQKTKISNNYDYRLIIKTVKMSFFNREIWKTALLPGAALIPIMILAPFSIIFFYAIGMSTFAAAFASMLTMAAMAGGMASGGYFADKGKIKEIFIGGLYASTFLIALLFAVTVFSFGTLNGQILTVLIFLIISLIQGAIQAARTKYSFNKIPDGKNISFATALFLQSLMAFPISGASSLAASFFIKHEDFIKNHIYNNFHYLHAVILLALTIGILEFSIIHFIIMKNKNLNKIKGTSCEKRKLAW